MQPSRPSREKRGRKIVPIIPILVACLLAVLPSCTHPVRRLVYQPHMIDHIPVFPSHIAGIERFWLEVEAGRIEGWLLGNRGEGPSKAGPAVMMAHGNRELIDHYLDRALRYKNMGFTVMLGEYRGYGRSEGRPSREGIRNDFIRFYDKLAALPHVDEERIVFHGRSLGGAVLADVVPYRQPAAVILESTFTSIKAMAHGAPDFFLSDRYDTPSAMATFKGPVLILHGTDDQVVPVAHARQLKRKIPQAELITGDFGHSDPLLDMGWYWSVLRRFYEKHRMIDTGLGR